MKFILTTLFVLSLCIVGHSQQNVLDSLTIQIKQYNTTPDSNYVLLRNAYVAQKINLDPMDTSLSTFAKVTLQIAKDLDFPRGQVLTYQKLGVINQHFLDQPLIAIDYYQKALDVIDLHPKLNHFTASSLGNIATIYFEQQDYDKALSAYKEVDEKFGDKVIMAHYIGNIYGMRNQYDSAIMFYDKALASAKEKNNIVVLAYTHSALSLMLSKVDRIDEAVSNMEQSIALVDQHGLELVRNIAYVNASMVYLAAKDYTASEKYCNLAINSDQALNNLNAQKGIYGTLFELYEAKGEYKKSLEAHKKFVALTDSLSNEDQRVETARMEIEFEASKKEMIAIRQMESEAQKGKYMMILSVVMSVFLLATLAFLYVFYRQRKKLDVLNSELIVKNDKINTLNRQNFHFTKNALSEIVGMLQVQANRLADGQVRHVLLAEKLRIETVNLLYNQLFASSSQGIGQEELIEVGSFLKDVVNNSIDTLLDMHASAVQLSFDLDSVPITKEKSLALGLITNELTINACKYAFQGHQNGTFAIKIKLENQNFTLTLSDNGPGLPDDLHHKKGSGFGMQLIQLLTSDLQAKWLVTSEKSGLTNTFTIPL